MQMNKLECLGERPSAGPLGRGGRRRFGRSCMTPRTASGYQSLAVIPYGEPGDEDERSTCCLRVAILSMADSWRRLRIGDLIRIVRMPSGVDEPGYTFHPDTRRLYKKLIARRRAVRVFRITEDKLPWIHCRFQRENGAWEYHWLAVNDDSWVRVKRRT
jgi:hypothetical protein